MYLNAQSLIYNISSQNVHKCWIVELLDYTITQKKKKNNNFQFFFNFFFFKSQYL